MEEQYGVGWAVDVTDQLVETVQENDEPPDTLSLPLPSN